MTGPRVLPPDVFDALELSALVFDGIGHGKYSEEPTFCLRELQTGEATPCCIHGHAKFLGGPDIEKYRAETPLYRAGINVAANDHAFARDEERIPFAEWCRRLNVVRGSEPTYDAGFVALLAQQFPKKRPSSPPVSRKKRSK